MQEGTGAGMAELCPLNLRPCHAEDPRQKVVAAKDHCMLRPIAIRVDMSDRQVLSDSPGQPEQALISIRQPTSSFSGVA